MFQIFVLFLVCKIFVFHNLTLDKIITQYKLCLNWYVIAKKNEKAFEKSGGGGGGGGGGGMTP